MPRHLIFREELGARTREIIGDLSLEQASIRTNLAAETIRKMKMGKVPEPQTLKAFADGFRDRGADYHELMVICGYEESEDLVERAERAFRGRLPDEDLELIKARLREIQQDIQKRSEGGST